MNQKNFTALFFTIASLTPKLKLSIFTLLLILLPFPTLANYKINVSSRPPDEDIITLKVQVLDEQNIPIENLTAADFKIETAKIQQRDSQGNPINLQFSPINKLVLTPPSEELKPDPAYVVILLDMSGSMIENDASGVKKLDGAIKAIRGFVQLVRDNNLPVHIALVPFNAQGESRCNYTVDQDIIDKSLLPAIDQRLDNLIQILANAQVCGSTDLYNPLKETVSFLGNPGNFSQSNHSNNLESLEENQPVIPPKLAVFLLSDGYHSINQRAREKEEFADLEQVLQKNPAVKVYTLGYGESLINLRDRAKCRYINDSELEQENAVDLIRQRCQLSDLIKFIVDQPRLKQIAALTGGISAFPENENQAVSSLETFFKALREYELRYKQPGAEPAEEYQIKISVKSSQRGIETDPQVINMRIPVFFVKLPLFPDRLIILILTLAMLGGGLWYFKRWSNQLKQDAERWL
ncbi:MAG TPA: vWA domain-containing protein [Nostocaceae cyanobacterium]|nr:vWA domain-containing protein [Nostocaceae cyanobacterium]